MNIWVKKNDDDGREKSFSKQQQNKVETKNFDFSLPIHTHTYTHTENICFCCFPIWQMFFISWKFLYFHYSEYWEKEWRKNFNHSIGFTFEIFQYKKGGGERERFDKTKPKIYVERENFNFKNFPATKKNLIVYIEWIFESELENFKLICHHCRKHTVIRFFSVLKNNLKLNLKTQINLWKMENSSILQNEYKERNFLGNGKIPEKLEKNSRKKNN